MYVFGGFGRHDRLETIEVLDLASALIGMASRWSLVRMDEIGARAYPLFCPMGANHILILGGEYSENVL